MNSRNVVILCLGHIAKSAADGLWDNEYLPSTSEYIMVPMSLTDPDYYGQTLVNCMEYVRANSERPVDYILFCMTEPPEESGLDYIQWGK